MFHRVVVQVVEMSGEIDLIANDMVVIAMLPYASRGYFWKRCQTGEAGPLEAADDPGNVFAYLDAYQQMQVIVEQHVAMVTEPMQSLGCSQCVQHLHLCRLACQPGRPSSRHQGEEQGLINTRVVAAIRGHARIVASQ